MKRMTRVLALLVITMLLTLGLAQQTQGTQQQTQETQQQQGEQGQQGQQDQAQQDMATDELFVMAAAHNDMYEIASSQLANQVSTNEDIQAFAQRMVEDHTNSSERLRDLAEQAGIPMSMGQTGSEQTGTEGTTEGTEGEQAGTEQTEQEQTEQEQTEQEQTEQAGTEQMNTQAPTMPDPAHQLKLIQLMSLQGEAFDRAYVMQQVVAHQAAINLFEIQAELGQEEELRNFANESLPILREHLAMALDLMAQLGMSLEDIPSGQGGGSN
jgi:predicted outer membrane protein